MKVRFLFLVMLLSSALYACSPEQDRMFSCDDNIEAWIRENLEEIRTFSRAQFLRTAGWDREWEISLLMAVTTEQRRHFWMEKMEETLRLEWSERERAHIQSMIDFAKIMDIFDFTKDPPREVEIFEYKWINYALEELGWSRHTLYAVAMTLQPFTETMQWLEQLLKDNTRQLLENSTNNVSNVNTRSGGNCVCRTSFDCPMSRECVHGGCWEQRRCAPLLALCTGVCFSLVGGGGCPPGPVPLCPPPRDYVVFFPHPNSRHWFFKCCVNGVISCEECPDDLVWNSELQTCDWSHW